MMKVYDNGTYRELTPEEIAEMQQNIPSIPYEQRVVDRIRTVYSLDEELALQRKATMAMLNGEQAPEEFKEYNTFVEQIKSEEKWRLV